MEQIENRAFDDLHIGETASFSRTLTDGDIAMFATLAGDANPSRAAPAFEKGDTLRRLAELATWSGALISSALGAKIPWPGAIELSQTFRFVAPAAAGDTVTVRVTVARKRREDRSFAFDCVATNQRNDIVASGTVELVESTASIARAEVPSPAAFPETWRHHHRLIERAKGLAPIRTAVVHPVDAMSLLGAVDAARAKIIEPILVGPEAKIRAAAKQAGVDISAYQLAPTEHSHAAAAAAVALARDHAVDALMKGSLHTDEFMGAIVGEERLRTSRRMSHVFVIDAPSYPRPLFVTDAALNIYPTLDEKRDIILNAIELAHALGVSQPRVAILSAVETVTEKLKSTLDAAALCKMADRGQITGGLLDGPLAFDNAVSEEAARTKGIVSPVAGRADIFVVPDMEAGNMLAKQLEYLAGAQVAGVVLGARVPIILTSRADTASARLASCAIALLAAHHAKRAES